MRTLLWNGRERPVDLDIDRKTLGALRGFGKLQIYDLFTLHWSVIATAKGTYDVLRRRGLSAHFIIDADGTIHQTLDLGSIAALTRGVNDRSVGVEIANPVELPRQNRARPRPRRKLGVNGEKREHLDFYPAQKRAVVTLTTAVCTLLDIPLVVPGDAAGKPRATTLEPEALAAFRGVVGHYHVTARKIDPGLGLWDDFLAAGYRLG